MPFSDPTRAAALDAMDDFAPRMGRHYASRRNYDLGAGHHAGVSQLSPFLRRRLLTEPELVARAVAAHGPDGAEKYVQEVFWRTYFKGWLELRPQVWDDYRIGLAQDRRDHDGSDRIARVCAGQSGMECMDAWAQELIETGYLHNHARMWFASIWIFTWDLPWRIGADFFYRHLLDGDAASNTLSWRWVAGLHTRGRPYPAQARNIAQYTEGRFHPADRDLAEVTDGLQDQEPDGLPPVQPLRKPAAPTAGRPTALLITDEDCRVEDFDLAALDIRACATLAASHLRSCDPVADLVKTFEAGALADAADRAGQTAEALTAGDPQDLAEWAARHGVAQIATPFVTRGPLRDWLDRATPALEENGIRLVEWQRDWDRDHWPHAKAGFFKMKKRIPDAVARLSV